jgi:UDP-N-acetyl-D-galactosamine dehydrogenase
MPAGPAIERCRALGEEKAMAFPSLDQARISVIGLGYVGLPLALGLARHFRVLGFDVDRTRIEELERGIDRTGETKAEKIKSFNLGLTADEEKIAGSDIFIVTVPTPVDAYNKPDLGALIDACRIVGKGLKRGAVVVFESTVYPGVTEDVCGGELAAASGLSAESDFALAYSPERINPGDARHRVDKIAKVVAASTPQAEKILKEMYGKLTTGGVHVAKNIKTAEAAKVIENAQRDINIAFINEVAQIFSRMGISTLDVLDAASTKWNFLPFKPGLVGGHCIGVDPYYLAHAAEMVGHRPEIILAGRRINDGMAAYVARSIWDILISANGATNKKILFLGLTFKEDVPDLRNSKAAEVVGKLKEKGFQVDVYDPIADAGEAMDLYGIGLLPGLIDGARYDCLVGAVAHKAFRALDGNALAGLMLPGGLLADIKGIWRGVALADGLKRWEL